MDTPSQVRAEKSILETSDNGVKDGSIKEPSSKSSDSPKEDGTKTDYSEKSGSTPKFSDFIVRNPPNL